MTNHISSYLIQLQHTNYNAQQSAQKIMRGTGLTYRLNKSCWGQPLINISGICWLWTYNNGGRNKTQEMHQINKSELRCRDRWLGELQFMEIWELWFDFDVNRPIGSSALIWSISIPAGERRTKCCFSVFKAREKLLCLSKPPSLSQHGSLLAFSCLHTI